MNEHDDVICEVRESFSGLRMDMPVEKVFAGSRARRRRRLSGLTAAAAATARDRCAITVPGAIPMTLAVVSVSRSRKIRSASTSRWRAGSRRSAAISTGSTPPLLSAAAAS